jgi:hypothetical protein
VRVSTQLLASLYLVAIETHGAVPMLRLLAAGAMLAASPSIYMMFHSHAEAYVRKGLDSLFFWSSVGQTF